MSKSVSKDSFLGDLLNALLLKNPYREPVSQPAEAQESQTSQQAEEQDLTDTQIVESAAAVLIAAEAFKSAISAREEQDGTAFTVKVPEVVSTETESALRTLANIHPGNDFKVTDRGPDLGASRGVNLAGIVGSPLPPLSYQPESSAADDDAPTGELKDYSKLGQSLSAAGMVLSAGSRTFDTRPAKVVLDGTEARIAKLVVAGKSSRRIARVMKRPLNHIVKRLMVLELKYEAKSRQDLRNKLISQSWTTADEVTESLLKFRRTNPDNKYSIAKPVGSKSYLSNGAIGIITHTADSDRFEHPSTVKSGAAERIIRRRTSTERTTRPQE